MTEIRKIDEPTLQRDALTGKYSVGLRCSLDGCYKWKNLKARRKDSAKRDMVGAVIELLRESAQQWGYLATKADQENVRLCAFAAQLETETATIESMFPLNPEELP